MSLGYLRFRSQYLRQLVVVHGIVMERTQELSSGAGVYTERCCPNSYGVVVRQPYDPIQHQGEDVIIDPRDKNKWAERQIHWFIRQVSIGWRSPLVSSCLTTPSGPECLGCGRRQAPLSFEDRPGEGEDTMEDSDRDVFSPSHAAAPKHETRWCEDGLRSGISTGG